jgi:hypothetical protein
MSIYYAIISSKDIQNFSITWALIPSSFLSISTFTPLITYSITDRERERERETEREREMWNGSKGHTIGEWVSEKRGGGGVCVYKKAFGAWENGVSLLSTKKELLGPSDGAGKGHPPL